MHSRRNKHHHAETMIRRFAIVTLAALIVASGSVAFADNIAMTSNGLVHTVTSEYWKQDGTVSGTVLVHSIQFPDGNLTERQIPGTDDYPIDINPVLDIDPVTEHPVLVWVRNDGSGFGLYVARFDDNSWTTPSIICNDGDEDLQIQLRIRRNLIQVYWERDTHPDMHVRMRMALDRTDLQPVFGPEELWTGHDDNQPIPSNGDDGPDSSDDPTTDHAHFSSILPALTPSDPAVIVVWGVRDDPVVVDYTQTFDPLPGAQNAQEVGTKWAGANFMLWFTSTGSFHYSLHENGAWSEFRILEMDDGMTSAQAIDLIEQMIERADHAQEQ